jgi:G3E family GTPase
MSRNKRIPVTLLTGFLGSGKTTFLNHLIRERLPERVMVIENEVGQTNVDGALVEPGVEEVIELTAGCLCCSLSDGLLDALEVVSARQEEFDRLVIETTGVADPGSIVQVFLADPLVGRFFDLEQVICVTDAELIEDWLAETEEALRQIVMADVILLNKVDTISNSYRAELVERMQAISPHALILSGKHGRFPLDQVLWVKTANTASFENRLAAIPNQRDHVDSQAAHGGGNQHRIDTFTLTFERPFVLDDYFSLQLHRLVSLYRAQVYRIKGILHVRDYPNRVILQSVRTSCVITDGSPWVPGEIKTSKLVFIGKGLKKEAFQQMFNRFTQKIQHESN